MRFVERGKKIKTKKEETKAGVDNYNGTGL